MNNDIYNDKSNNLKKSNFNIKFEKYKKSRLKIKRTKNSGFRRLKRIFKKEKIKIFIIFIILIVVLLLLFFSAISQFILSYE